MEGAALLGRLTELVEPDFLRFSQLNDPIHRFVHGNIGQSCGDVVGQYDEATNAALRVLFDEDVIAAHFESAEIEA